tara:strand:- start:399 stop:914 length:516 start_codon:yes stop_codon:yes gene_type:complete
MKKKIIQYNESISTEYINDNSNICINIDLENKIEISKRLDLIKLDFFEMNIKYSKVNKIESLAKYTVNAVGEQKCVISLNPVQFKINKLFDMKLINYEKLDLSQLDDEFIEPVYNNKINFGEIGIQIFSSFLDPYPKINNEDINLNRMYNNDGDSKLNKKNPFEVLNNINK